MREQKSTISPVSLSERILSLDVLRGFAVLGILIMNIQSYSMIEAAYINPTAYGDLTGINKWVWILQLYISPIWIRHFKFGPVEWLWRTLTYWKFQPMKYRHSN